MELIISEEDEGCFVLDSDKILPEFHLGIESFLRLDVFVLIVSCPDKCLCKFYRDYMICLFFLR